MGWKTRTGVPSDASLKVYDDRVAAREAEIRRPGRSKEILKEAEEDRKAAAKRHNPHEEFLKQWIKIYMNEVSRRNKLVRYKLFLFFKENYNLEDQNTGDLSLRGIAAVCKSITKDVALYCQLMAVGEEMKKWSDAASGQGDGANNQENWRRMQCSYLAFFSRYELGIPVDQDDLLSLLDAYQLGVCY